MRKHCGISVSTSKIVSALFLVFAVSGPALATQESTIFTFDGQDFIRKHTTLLTEDGKSANNTKLDRSTAAYKALIKKQSYIGEITAFGQTCDAGYAPLLDKGGRLTGALFVCIKQ